MRGELATGMRSRKGDGFIFFHAYAVFCRTSTAGGAFASRGGGPPQINTSGHKSAPLGQATVPSSTRASRKRAESRRIDSKMGPTRRDETSRSITVSFVSVRRSRNPSSGTTPRILKNGISFLPYSSGAMGSGERPLRARSQSRRNSTLWRAAHSNTSAKPRRGRFPL